MTDKRLKKFIPVRFVGVCLLALVWLVMNIRVEAGAASQFERTLDGLVGGTLLLVFLFKAVPFFDLTERLKK